MRREAGFTLVELLAALVSGSLLLVAIGWSLSGIVRLVPVDPSEAGARRLAAIAPRLTALIEQAGPTGFAGTSDRLEMTVPPPMAAGDVGPLRLTLQVRGEAGGKSLHAAFEPVAPEMEWPQAARAQQIAGGFRDIRFDYQMADQTSGAPRLPRLVTITFDDGTRVRRLSAMPRLDSDGTCRFDPVSMTCRS